MNDAQTWTVIAGTLTVPTAVMLSVILLTWRATMRVMDARFEAVRSEFGAVRSEFGGELAAFRGEVAGEFVKVHAEIAALREISERRLTLLEREVFGR